jgi:hypothetical protein
MVNTKYSDKNYKGTNIELATHFPFVVSEEVYAGVNDNAYTLTKIPPQSFHLNRHSGKTRKVAIPVAPRGEGRLLNRLTSMTNTKTMTFIILHWTLEAPWISFKCTTFLLPLCACRYCSPLNIEDLMQPLLVVIRKGIALTQQRLLLHMALARV